MEDHKRVILHLDIDYFYAQVEELLNPELKSIPFGVKQGNYVVTCNYVARDRGVGKWKKISECIEKCPELTLVPGEDLQNYKKYSKKLHILMQEIFPNETLTERLGMDELFIDITNYVESRMDDEETVNFSGPILPDEDAFAKCDCGCEQRLKIGSVVASYTRKKLFDEIGLTCSVGVAHNKILSKLVGQMNKPNNSTVLAPVYAKSFMAELNDIRNIMGIGKVIEEKLKSVLNIHTIIQLQNFEFDVLQKEFGNNMASRLKQLANGIDTSSVKQSGKVKSIGLESSFRPVSAGSDITENFQSLLTRLLVQVKDDDTRIPQTLRVTVRKYDLVRGSSRESRQNPFPPNCFKLQDGKISLTEGSEAKIMQNIMRLFNRMVDKTQSYKITLIGLCCTNFQSNQGSIDKYLINKSHDIEVQSQTNINYGESMSRARIKSISPLIEEASNLQASDNEEEEEDDVLEAPTKKLKVKILDQPEDFLDSPSTSACSSPSAKLCDISGIKISCNAPQIDQSVWNEIPTEIQQELMSNWQKIVANNSSSSTTITKQATKRVSTDIGSSSKIHKYFIKIPK